MIIEEYKPNVSGALQRSPRHDDETAGPPRKTAGLVVMRSGEVGRLIGNATDGFTLATIHPTYEDAERTEIGVTLGDEVTVEAVDRLLVEKRQRDRDDALFLTTLKTWWRP